MPKKKPHNAHESGRPTNEEAFMAALKIVGFYFDNSTPQFLLDVVIVALGDAGRELGILKGGFWPQADGVDEMRVDLETVAAIYQAGGKEYELSRNPYALKAALILANPNTPAETRSRLKDAISDFGNTMQVFTDHPALVERALTVMFESVNGKGIYPAKQRREDRKDLLVLLDSIEE
jgi:hypothetical protein